MITTQEWIQRWCLQDDVVDLPTLVWATATAATELEREVSRLEDDIKDLRSDLRHLREDAGL